MCFNTQPHTQCWPQTLQSRYPVYSHTELSSGPTAVLISLTTQLSPCSASPSHKRTHTPSTAGLILTQVSGVSSTVCLELFPQHTLLNPAPQGALQFPNLQQLHSFCPFILPAGRAIRIHSLSLTLLKQSQNIRAWCCSLGMLKKRWGRGHWRQETRRLYTCLTIKIWQVNYLYSLLNYNCEYKQIEIRLQCNSQCLV